MVIVAPIETFKKNGYSYELLNSNVWNTAPTKNQTVVGAALYKQFKPDYPIVYYEVHLLRWHPTLNTGHFIMEEGINLPSNEDFGKFGWAFQTQEAATRKYRSLITEVQNGN